MKALEEKIKNNEKFMTAMKHDIDNNEKRRKELEEGLESKTIDHKFNLEREITSLKSELKQLRLEEHEL